ncbi:MAG: OmpA family protein [Bacteroidota bacterium]
MTSPTRFFSVALCSLLLLLALPGCSTTNNAKKGAVIGAGAGAAVGGVIGRASGKTARGVLIGAAVGGATGAIIGRQMDRQAAELERELEGATVERMGEGIKITFDSALLFAVDSDELSRQAGTQLADLAQSLEDYPDTLVLIVGHTDSTGPAEYNQALSERRAESAALQLMREGIPATRLEIVGYGEEEPTASNETATGRQQNRRVEVAIYASEDYVESLGS